MKTEKQCMLILVLVNGPLEMWFLTHCGLVTPYGTINVGQHWLSWWLIAWQHQAITWTNVDLSSVGSSGIHMRAI